MQKQRPPAILWGEHRSTELIAMGVKEKLASDPSIISRIPILEYKMYPLTDHIRVLRKKKKAVLKGVTPGEFDKKMKNVFKPQVRKYEQLLIAKYGPLLFNLHDGNVMASVDGASNIGFLMPDDIRKDELSRYLESVGGRHDLVVYIPSMMRRIKYMDGEIHFHPSVEIITVEFLPPPSIKRDYPSEEIRNLVRELEPELSEDVGDASFKSKVIANFSFTYKILDVKNPAFHETVDKYAGFMKDVLIGLHDKFQIHASNL